MGKKIGHVPNRAFNNDSTAKQKARKYYAIMYDRAGFNSYKILDQIETGIFKSKPKKSSK